MRLASLLLLPALAGCPSRSADAGPPVPAGSEAPAPGGQVTVELTAYRLQGGDDSGGRVTAQGGQGSVIVQGALSTPNPCYTFTGSVRRDGSAVTLTVEAHATEGMCVQSIGAFSYDATVHGLPAGSYSFRVVHTYPGTGWESRGALETMVTVR
jgi:hypothetical protein